MHRKQISQTTAPSVQKTAAKKQIVPTPSYEPLSLVVQRVQQDPKSMSADERQQLENVIGSRSTREILAAKQTSWQPEFQGISVQLWGNAEQVVAPIQAKGKNGVTVSKVQPDKHTANSPVQRMTFNRFTWGGTATNWGWYNEKEKELLNLEQKIGKSLESLKKYENDDLVGQTISDLQYEFSQVSSGDYKTEEYPNILEKLKVIDISREALYQTITLRDDTNPKQLNELLKESFDIVDERTDISKPNQITKDQFQEINNIINDIYYNKNSNLKIELGSVKAYNLAQRAESRSLSVPKELKPLENEMTKIRQQIDEYGEKIRPLSGKKMTLQTSKLNPEDKKQQIEQFNVEISKLKKKQEELEQKESNLIKQYESLVQEIIRMEVMKDLIKISQTEVGRDLLRQIAKTSLEKTAKQVKILAYQEYKLPDAGDGYLNYTPQYFRDRDTLNRTPDGAITKLEALKDSNPWQENDRTDITLFHEIVHTYHYQSGTAKTDNNLVSADEVSDPVDSPYESVQLGEVTQSGVKQEEYYTVGLEKYANEKYTENAYRRERQLMGENVALRGHYIHKGKDGEREIS